MNELKWLSIAKSLIGTKEIKGKEHNPIVVNMWKVAFTATNQSPALNQAVWQNDETPWCGGFVGYVMASTGLKHHIPKAFPMARSWAKAGTKLTRPAYGCVVVFSRGNPKGVSGHVGFVVGRDKFGNLMVLGGNQGDMVNIKPFSVSRVIAYRWCGTQNNPASHRYNLPVLGSDGRVSNNES